MSYTLSEVPTNALLGALRSHQRYDYDHEDTDLLWVHQRPANTPTGFEVVRATVAEIHAALVGRPHVPSKTEAKLLRRLRAQTGMTEAQLRAHPKYGMELVDVQFPNRRELKAGDPRVQLLSKYLGSTFGKRYKVKK